MKLLCSACDKPYEAKAYESFSLCPECDRRAQAWAAESERTKRELAEQRRSSPRYASLRALLTCITAEEPARLASRVAASAD